MTEFIINDGVIKFNLNAVVTITPIPPVEEGFDYSFDFNFE